MLLFFGFSLIVIFGYLLSTLFVGKMHPLERMGTSFLLGFGIFTLLMFCYSTFGVKITLQSTLIVLVICIGFLFTISKLFKRKMSINLLGFVKSFSNLSKMEKIIVLALIALGTGSLIISTYFPVYIWDALALYDFRAKVIAEQGFYTQIVKNFWYFDGYPLFTSLSHTLVYIFKSTNPQFLYSLMYLSFIFIFYSNLREFADRKISLIASLILATTPTIFDHSTFAYTNLPYTIFLATGSIYLFTWLIKKKPIGYLVLAGVFTGLSTWTRSAEPFWMVNIFMLVFFSIYRFKKYLLPTFIYIICFLFIREPWKLVNYYQYIDTGAVKTSPVVSEVGAYATTLFETTYNQVRISEVAIFIYKNVIVSWLPLIILFLFCIFINFKNFLKKANTLFLVIIILYFALLLYGTYIFSFNNSTWSAIPDSARRMAMFFMPLMIFYIGLSLGELDINADKKNIRKV
jgi:hypothetical protein